MVVEGFKDEKMGMVCSVDVVALRGWLEGFLVVAVLGVVDFTACGV